MSTSNVYQDLEKSYGIASILLKGPPGAGKTWKAAQFPKPAIFNFDNNLTGLRRLPPEVRKNIRVVNPRHNEKGRVNDLLVWDNFIRQLKVVLADDSIQTVVFDSLTTLGNILLDKVLGDASPSKRVEIQHYGDFCRYMKWLGDDVLCAEDRDKIFIFLAHEQERDGRLTLNLPTSELRDSFDLYFSDCWRCFVHVPVAGNIQYKVRTIAGTNFNAKNSLDLPKEFEWDKEKDNIMAQLTASFKRNNHES